MGKAFVSIKPMKEGCGGGQDSEDLLSEMRACASLSTGLKKSPSVKEVCRYPYIMLDTF